MNLKKKVILKYFLIALLGVIIATFFTKNKKEYSIKDWNDIFSKGEINIVTTYNSIDYYLEGDSIKGFQYELIQALFKEKGIKVNITPSIDLNKQITDLKGGKYDLLATNLIVTSELKDQIALSVPILKNKQVLVQRKDSLALANSTYIENQLDLAKKTLYIVKGSPALLRIKNLSNEIADTIYTNEVDKYGEEQLIALVAHGDIDYAVCNENLALKAIDSLPQLDTQLAISFTQFYSWGINKDSPILLDSLNHWISNFQEKKAYQDILNKYYH